MSPDPASTPIRPLVFGHRGAAGLLPENTLPSFDKAVELGVDGVELDVYAAHGELWVIHDDTLNRTTSRLGTLTDYSPAELRRIDAGGGAGIPTLAEVLARVPATVQVNIELKGPNTAAPVLALTRALPQQRLLISSFDHQQLRQYRALGGATRIGVLLNRWDTQALITAQQLQAWSVNLASRISTQQRVRRVHEAGFRVLVYTVNSRRTAARLLGFGVDGLFTDRPDRINRAALAG